MATSKLAMREQRRLGHHDLGEDRGVGGDDDVVLGDDVLAVAGARDLADVDALERVDERHDEDEPGSWVCAVLAEALDDADGALLDDVHHAAQRGQQHDDHEGGDGESDDGGDRDGDHDELSPCEVDGQVSVRRPDDERRPLHARDEDLGAGRQRMVAAADGAPPLAGQLDVPDVVGIADHVERDDLVADEPAVHARAAVPAAALHQPADARSHQQHAERR